MTVTGRRNLKERSEPLKLAGATGVGTRWWHG